MATNYEKQEPLPLTMTNRIYAYWAQGDRTLEDLYDDLCIPSRYGDATEALWESLEEFKAENPDVVAWDIPGEIQV